MAHVRPSWRQPLPMPLAWFLIACVPQIVVTLAVAGLGVWSQVAGASALMITIAILTLGFMARAWADDVARQLAGQTVWSRCCLIAALDAYVCARGVARVGARARLGRVNRGERGDAPVHRARVPTRTGDPFDVDGFAMLFARLRERSGIRTFSAHILRHTWATNFMSVPGANLLELKRQGGWERWEMVERHSHRVPVRDRLALPNPLDPSHKTAFGQPPSSTVSRLSRSA